MHHPPYSGAAAVGVESVYSSAVFSSAAAAPPAPPPPPPPPPPSPPAPALSECSHVSYNVCGTRFDVESHYRLIAPIGHGAYGVVCSAEDTRSGEKVAIKKITKGSRTADTDTAQALSSSSSSSSSNRCQGDCTALTDRYALCCCVSAFNNLVETKRTLREVQLLRCCRHANIIEIVSLMRPVSFELFEDVYVVSELMSSDLHSIIVSEQPLTDEHVQYFLYQILRGLRYLHSAHVIHRDLKPSNLLVNANCDLKIADFGLARCATTAAAAASSAAAQHSPHHRRNGSTASSSPRSSPGSSPSSVAGSAAADTFLTEYVATRWYRAPEIMLSWSEYSQSIDVWSVGCIFGELLGRRPMFPGSDYMHQLHLILDFIGSPSPDDTAHIANDNARNYIRSLPERRGVSIAKMFPRASEAACSLLQSMLTFAPHKRITAEQALCHPYLALLHDPNDEPTAEQPLHSALADEQISCDKRQFKRLLWKEIQHFHPSLPDPPDAATATITSSTSSSSSMDTD